MIFRASIWWFFCAQFDDFSRPILGSGEVGVKVSLQLKFQRNPGNFGSQFGPFWASNSSDSGGAILVFLGAQFGTFSRRNPKDFGEQFQWCFGTIFWFFRTPIWTFLGLHFGEFWGQFWLFFGPHFWRSPDHFLVKIGSKIIYFASGGAKKWGAVLTAYGNQRFSCFSVRFDAFLQRFCVFLMVRERNFF